MRNQKTKTVADSVIGRIGRTIGIDDGDQEEGKTSAEVVGLGIFGQQELYRPLHGPNGSPRKPVRVTALPYYAWANRGANAMRVWIPRATLG